MIFYLWREIGEELQRKEGTKAKTNLRHKVRIESKEEDIRNNMPK